jgi:Uma2 family endonuclease
MNATFVPTRMRMTIERYQKMVATGVLTPEDRVELIEGEILAMAPIGSQHARITRLLQKRFVTALGDTASVGAANPIDLGTFSEPEPDLVILRNQPGDYALAHPKADDVLLLIEVADSSLVFDQTSKRDLYARFGIPEYWVIDIRGKRVITFCRPVDGKYQEVRELPQSASALSPRVFPAVEIALQELFT